MSDSLSTDGIAIVGMAGRFPMAGNVDEFWANLVAGRDCFREFSVDELVAAGLPREVAERPNYVRRSPVVDRPQAFDAHAFGFSPKEAELIDPQHRLLMECAWEALEHAGHDPHRFDGSIGIWAGCGVGNYFLKNILSQPGHFEALSNFGSIVGNDKDYLCSRIAYKLGFRGPAVGVQTACSTSLVAVHNACQGLLTFQCDLALAGGVSLQFPRAPGYLFHEGEIFSADGVCRTFDRRANGTVLGEGAGLLVLRRLEEALAAGDRILAVIRGSAVNNDGAARAGFTAPGVAGQAELIAMAHAAAGVTAGEVSYVEAHGTGTALGDPIEVAALTKAFRSSTSERGFCALSAVKPNIGHLDVAAGIAGLIKTVCALQHRELPPTLHYTEPNPELGLAESPFFVVDRRMDWQPRNGRRVAGVSSFGMGGTNAHVVVEEFVPPTPLPAPPSQGWCLLPLSAATETALEAARGRLAAHLETASPQPPLGDVAFTLTDGRPQLRHRECTVAGSTTEAIARLRKTDELFAAAGKAHRTERPVAFLFSGQGTQYPGMGSGLFREHPVFRDAITRCATLLGPLGGRASLLEILYGDNADRELLNQTAISQPALFSVGHALARLWESLGVKPAAVAGHSIGEYLAACEAGIFSLEDTLAIVRERARLMQSMEPGAMVAFLRPEAEVRALMPASLDLAVINGPAVCVVSGPGPDVDAFLVQLEQRGINGQRLHTSHAFHSRMMDGAARELAAVVARVPRRAPALPILSNLTGTWMTDEQAVDPQYWSQHLRNAVRFGDNLAALARRFDSAILLELGPGNTLCSIARQQPPAVTALPAISTLRHPRQRVDDEPFRLRALGALWCHGATIDPGAFRPAGQARRCELPTYPFEREPLLVGFTPHSSGPHRPDTPRPHWWARRAGEPADASPMQPADPREPQALTLEALTELWREMLGTKVVQLDDDFFDLGGHSLLAAQLFVRLRDRFGVNAPLSALFDAPTPRRLHAKLTQTNAHDWQAWVPIVSGGDRTPVILVHGAEGNVLLYREMALRMQPGQPVFGLQCKGLDGRGGHHTRIEDMARDYVAEVQRQYPAGPLILGGYCMGGAVALEMAQQFRTLGRPVALVLMIESYNYLGCGVHETALLRLTHRVQNLWFHAHNLLRARRHGKGSFLRQKLHVELSRVKSAGELAWAAMARALGLRAVADYPHIRLSAVNDAAYFAYTPADFDGAIAVIRPEHQFARYNRPDCGWGQIAKGPLDIHVLPVSPRGMLVEPFAADLAAAVQTAVSRTLKTPGS